MHKDISPQFLSNMRNGIVASFNTGEIINLCTDLGINYENIEGEGKENKTRELIAYANRRGLLSDLLSYCISARPKTTWPTKKESVPQFISPITHCEANSKITILFLAADPTDTSRLRLGEEVRGIQEKLQQAKLRDRFTYYQKMSSRPTDLSQALLDTQPQIVHFSGHGSIDGALYFETQTGQAHPIQSTAIAALFEQFSSHVNCVVLNACYSETQAKAIAQHIEHVVGMKQAISDKASIAFSIGFYQALGAGRSVEEAYKLGCVQIGLQGIHEHLTPIMIKRNK